MLISKNKVIALMIFSVGLQIIVKGQEKLNDSDSSKNELNFFGSGNIQKSLETGEKLPASTGLGVSYSHQFGSKLLWTKIDKLELDASINVASTVDTIVALYDNNGAITNSSKFGASILTPLNAGQAVKIGLRLNFKDPLLWSFIDGVKVKYVGSNRNWEVIDNGEKKVIQGTNSYFRLGLFQEFLPKEYLYDYSINFGLYLAYNSIKGDIGQSANDEIQSNVLGTDKNSFIGPEFALEIRLKNLRAEFGYSWLKSDEQVPGLTGGRLLTTITFVGGFGVKLDKEKKKG